MRSALSLGYNNLEAFLIARWKRDAGPDRIEKHSHEAETHAFTPAVLDFRKRKAIVVDNEEQSAIAFVRDAD